jgi:hypothetical protein
MGIRRLWREANRSPAPNVGVKNGGTIPPYTFIKHRANFTLLHIISGVRGSVVVKALCYKPEGRGFETR